MISVTCKSKNIEQNKITRHIIISLVHLQVVDRRLREVQHLRRVLVVSPDAQPGPTRDASLHSVQLTHHELHGGEWGRQGERRRSLNNLTDGV